MCSLNDDNKGYRYDGSAWVLFSGAGPANFTNTATGTYTTGGISYKYITFTGSGDLIVDQAGFADVLLVAGGAGGGNLGAGGGGAGGMLVANSIYLPVGTLSVVVGAGGAGGAAGAVIPRPGNNGIGSSLSNYYSPGGGAGAVFAFQTSSLNEYAIPGFNGGSGGGSTRYNIGSAAAGGAGITNLGNSGGAGYGPGGNRGGGGGGGAGGAGAAGVLSGAGAGGIGLSNSITNTAVTYAVGGAGSLGANTGAAGTANRGNGGEGSGNGAAGGNGGSGLVIIRVVV